jgi:C4-dicarboxylate transporter
MVIGIVIIIIFLAMAVLMMMKKIPAMLALPIMAILIGAAAGLPLKGEQGLIDFVLVAGSLKLGGTYVAILFSCWLSQILYRSGVTNTLIKKAAELGGDKPFVVTLMLCAVTVFLFTTLYGTGAVAMVGAVVLPILLSVGISPIVASNVFLAAMSAGYSLNPANIALITSITGVKAADINLAAMVLAAAGCLFTVGYLAWSFKKDGQKFAFAAEVGYQQEAQVEPLAQVKGFRGFMACLTPLAVVVIMIIFKLPALAVFVIGILWAVIFTYNGNWSRNMNMIVQSFYEGFKEGAPTTGLMFGIGMILNAVTAPITQAVIKPFMVSITPTSATGLIIFVCLLCPLGLYRGPFNLQGLGAGLAASMLAVGAVPVAALSAVFYAAFRWPSQSCPTSTQVVWASNFVGLDPVTTTNKVQLPNWIMTAATVVILTFMYF